MNTLILQTHSEVNESLYQLTLPNHARYAGIHNYDMLQVNMSYKTAMDDWGQLVMKFLAHYDTIFTVGSDVLFTNMAVSLDELTGGVKKGIHISQEACFGSQINADTIIWRAGESCERAIGRLNDLREKVGSHIWGIQQAFNMLFNANPDDPDIDFMPVRKMQSAPVKEWTVSAWQPGDFSIHFLAEDNEKKYMRCKHYLDTGNIFWR